MNKKSRNKSVACSFTSVWDSDDGTHITTPCTYHPATGEVNPDVSTGSDPDGILMREFITLKDGSEIDVCTTCHGFVLTSSMNEGVGKQLHESKVCSNPDCESHA
jgi:hypothetical protein